MHIGIQNYLFAKYAVVDAWVSVLRVDEQIERGQVSHFRQNRFKFVPLVVRWDVKEERRQFPPTGLVGNEFGGKLSRCHN